MDKLLQFLTIGVPETVASLIFGIIVCKGNVFHMTLKKSMYLLIRVLIATVITLAVIITGKVFIKNLAITTVISIAAYAISFKGIFRLNYRQSILSAMLVMFSLVVLEVTTYPIIDLMMKNYAVKNEFILVLPSRLLQVLIISVLLRNKFSLSNNSLFTKKWVNLTFQNKLTLFFLNFLVFADIMFNANYIAITLKLQSKNIEPQFISFNLFLYLLQTILFMAVVLVSFTRTIDFEKYKEIVNKKPVDLFEEILINSSQDEIYEYSRMVIRHLHINRIVELERFLDYLKRNLEKFDYRVDENIAFIEQDYTDVANFIEFITTVELIKNKLIYADISKDEKNILCFVEVKNVDEIEMRKLQKELYHNKNYNALKEDLLSQKAILNVSHHNDVTFNIKIPFIKHYAEV